MDWESLVWNTDIPAMRKLVLLAIARKADASGVANISVIEISAAATMARQSVYDQITVAIQRNQLARIAPSRFRISLTPADSTLYATRTFSTPPVHAQIQVDTPRRKHLVRHPYTEIPFPLNNPLSNAPLVLSPVSSSSPVLENEELRQEQEVTREAQAELIEREIEPEWREVLETLAAVPVLPGQSTVKATDIALIEWAKTKGFDCADAIESATYLRAAWRRLKYQDVRAAFQSNLYSKRRRAEKEKANGSNNGTTGRYPRRGLGPAVIPDDPSYYDPGSKLSAFRR